MATSHTYRGVSGAVREAMGVGCPPVVGAGGFEPSSIGGGVGVGGTVEIAWLSPGALGLSASPQSPDAEGGTATGERWLPPPASEFCDDWPTPWLDVSAVWYDGGAPDRRSMAPLAALMP